MCALNIIYCTGLHPYPLASSWLLTNRAQCLQRNVHSTGTSRRGPQSSFLATYRAVTSQWGKFVAIDCHEWSPAACCNDYTLQILWNQCVLCVLGEMNYRFIKDYLWASQTLWLSSIFLQQKSFLNKRFVLLKVDRNSTEPCKFLQHSNALEDMQLGKPRIVCIKDAAKGLYMGSAKSTGHDLAYIISQNHKQHKQLDISCCMKHIGECFKMPPFSLNIVC